MGPRALIAAAAVLAATASAYALDRSYIPIPEINVYLHGFRNGGQGTGHWNEEGHRMAAELIGRRLCALM